MTDRESSPSDADADADADAKLAPAPAPPPPPPPVDVFERTRATWGFPSFARDFPNDPELGSLVAAFAAGDYATVRKGAPELASKTTDEHVKRAAELLRARIEPDPTSRVFFGLTAALLVFLMAWWATHDGKHHAASPQAKPQATVEIVK